MVRIGRIRWSQLVSYATIRDASQPPAQMILDIITSGAGSLAEMEERLDKLGIMVSPTLITQVTDSCIRLSAGNCGGFSRRLFRFFCWCQHQHPQGLGDDVFNHTICAIAQMKDPTAMRIAISNLQKDGRMMFPETFALVVQTLVRLGKEEDAISLFKSLERQKLLLHQSGGKDGCCSSILMLVHSLCAQGHPARARAVIWSHKRDLLTTGAPTASVIHQNLLHGWCVHGNAREARRAMDEMKLLEIRPGLASYNDFLYCICKRNVKFNPSALVPEATNLMTEMRSNGVSPTSISFNILLSCLGKVRRVKEAYRILYLMRQGEVGCSPDWTSYYIVVRVMYLTGRFVRGNRLVEEMFKDGILPGASFYHGLIGVLCGLEKVSYALEMFARMNRYCEQTNSRTYDLLIAKLGRGGKFEQARHLWDEAEGKGIVLQCSKDMLDPSKTEVFKPTTLLGSKRPCTARG